MSGELRHEYRIKIVHALDWELDGRTLSQMLVDEASEDARMVLGTKFAGLDDEGSTTYEVAQEGDEFVVRVSVEQEALPHSDSMTFEQLCKAAAWQVVWAAHQSYGLSDEQQEKVEEALTQALILRPASLEALIDNNVLPHSLIETWDQEAQEGEA